jgi:hypothetical protein
MRSSLAEDEAVLKKVPKHQKEHAKFSYCYKSKEEASLKFSSRKDNLSFYPL